MNRYTCAALIAITVGAASASAGYEQYALTYGYYGRYYAQLAQPQLGQPIMTEVINQIQAGIDNTTRGINTAYKPWYAVAKTNFDYAWPHLYSFSGNSDAYNAYYFCWYAQYTAQLAAQ